MEIPFLNNPSFVVLDDAYRGLPKLGEIHIGCDTENIEYVIANLESIGYVGMEVGRNDPKHKTCKIRAFKGKHGPCYNTGRTAIYSGGALAALDDDNHLFFNNEVHPICEKTAKIFQLPVYHGLIHCNPIRTDSSAEHSESPVKFSGNEFEDDLEKLFEKIQSAERSPETRKGFFYPGPFRYLILKDGTIITRGKANNIPEDESKLLIKKDGLFPAEKDDSKLSFFQDLYVDQGSKCFLVKINFQQNKVVEYETDFEAIQKAGEKLKNKMINLINNHQKYFLLVGSDPIDQLGCCPSDAVGEANALVKAGILSALSQSGVGDNCPVTIYAFKGEIINKDMDIHFQIAESFRRKILKKMGQKPYQLLLTIAKWMLIGFVIVSLFMAYNKFSILTDQIESKSLYEYLSPANPGQVYIVLFHNQKRCMQCLNMEKFTVNALDGYFHKEYYSEDIKFKKIVMDKPENMEIVEELELISASIVLVSYDIDGKRRTKIVEDAWRLFNDQKKFMNMIRRETDKFIKD